MKNLTFLILTLTTINLCCQNKLDLNTKTISKHFSTSEIKDLNKLVNFTDSIIRHHNKNLSIEKAYHAYLDSIYSIASSGNGKIAVKEELKYKFLFNLNKEIFNKIWIKDSASKFVRTRDTTLYDLTHFPSIDLNHNGEFTKYIKSLASKNKNYSYIHKSITNSGSLPPSAISEFLNNHKDYNFNHPENRVWVSVFILTIEETVEQKVDRYIKNKFSSK